MHLFRLRTVGWFLLIISGLAPWGIRSGDADERPLPAGLVSSEFVFDEAPFPQCHASTLVSTPQGLVIAWFAGTREKNPDVGVWLSRQVDGKWTAPLEVANGIVGDKRYPCWNPVLFQPKEGPLMLFYKVGPSPSTWWGMLMTSTDSGKTWATPEKLPEGFAGPIKNKPVQLNDGTILCGSSTEDHGWRVHFEKTTADAKTWTKIGPIHDGVAFAAIQPSILFHPKGRLQILCRSKQGVITQAWSEDGGKTWSEMSATTLPNPNSGTDAITLKDGRQLLVYNHSTVVEGKWGGPRSPLNVAISSDGEHWQGAMVLESEPGEFSYPAVIQAADGSVHLTYTWKRKKVKHVVLDPQSLKLWDLVD